MMADAASRVGWDLIVCVLPSSVEIGRRLLQTARHSSAAPILAIGRATDPQMILQALRDGADEFVDIADWSDELFESVQRVMQRTHRHAGIELTGRVVTVLGAAGGVGTTTIAANLGAWLARSFRTWEFEDGDQELQTSAPDSRTGVQRSWGNDMAPYAQKSRFEPCAIYDLNIHRGDLTALFALESDLTISDFCRQEAPIDRDRFNRLFTRHESGVDVMAAPATISDSLTVTPQAIRLALALGRSRYRYQVLDVDVRDQPQRDEALWQADLVALILRLDLLCIRAAKRLLDSWEAEGFPVERVRLIANRVGQPHEIPASEAHEILGLPIWHQVIDDVRRANQGVNQGNLPVLRSRWQTICRNLQALADRVRQELPIVGRE